MRWLLTALLLAACRPPPVPSGRPSVEAARASRKACEFVTGAMAADTVGRGYPIGDELPFDHVVLVMQENRSFDHYFSQLSHGGVHVASNFATNPDADGVPVRRYHESRYCLKDVNHGWSGSFREFNGGKNDGFVVANDPNGARALAYYDETDLPWYYALVRRFAISDAHFASVLGPTPPNRLFYWAGTSFGSTNAAAAPTVDPATGRAPVSLFDRLSDAQVSWLSYVTDVASPLMFPKMITQDFDHFVGISQFYEDAAKGTLPSVSVVEGQFGGGPGTEESDEHPDANIQVGQAFVAKVTEAVMRSPLWPRTVLIITYDEHGGFYDSVPPPKACRPDATPPVSEPHHGFDQLGFRTPLIVVSPWARRGHVSHEVVDHTSITRLVETRFGLPAMTGRDANAWPLLDLFDFAFADTSVPDLPEAVVDPAGRAQCARDFP